MKAKPYFFSMFALVLLTGGLVGVLREPQITTTLAACILGLLVAAGIVMAIVGLCLLAGPQEQ